MSNEYQIQSTGQIIDNELKIPDNRSVLDKVEAKFIERKKEFESVLPPSISFDKFWSIVKINLVNNNKLIAAQLPDACLECAKDGLLPDNVEATLTVVSKKSPNGKYESYVQYSAMYQGLLKKLRNTGLLSSISCNVVYDVDNFDIILGTTEEIKHTPNLKAKSSEKHPIAVYAIINLTGNGTYIEYITTEEIDQIKEQSKTSGLKESPWNKYWGEMAKKVVLRRLLKKLPTDSELRVFTIKDDHKEFDFKNTKLELGAGEYE